MPLQDAIKYEIYRCAEYGNLSALLNFNLVNEKQFHILIETIQELCERKFTMRLYYKPKNTTYTVNVPAILNQMFFDKNQQFLEGKVCVEFDFSTTQLLDPRLTSNADYCVKTMPNFMTLTAVEAHTIAVRSPLRKHFIQTWVSELMANETHDIVDERESVQHMFSFNKETCPHWSHVTKRKDEHLEYIITNRTLLSSNIQHMWTFYEQCIRTSAYSKFLYIKYSACTDPNGARANRTEMFPHKDCDYYVNADPVLV